MSALINSLGSYDNSETYLGKIQSVLGKKRFNLKEFTYKLETIIEGEAGLKIQSSKGFSPFLCMQNYSIKQTEDSEIAVIYTESGKTLTEFSASSNSDGYTSLYEDFFASGYTSFKLFNNNDLDNTYPFADLCPEIYLNLESGVPVSILAKTYNTETELNIGKEAAEGTVIVYKNGRLTDSKYDKNTGNVSLSETVSDSDVIVISWQEDTVDFSQGAVAAGAGFKYNFTPSLQADISTTLLWPVYTHTDYATAESQKQAFAAISAGLGYETENLKLTVQKVFM